MKVYSLNVCLVETHSKHSSLVALFHHTPAKMYTGICKHRKISNACFFSVKSHFERIKHFCFVLPRLLSSVGKITDF